MLGVRDEASKAAFQTVKQKMDQLYRRPPVPLAGRASFFPGQPSTFSVSDPEGNHIRVSGPAPEAAKNKALSDVQIKNNLQKTGGTPYAFSQLEVQAAPGLFSPAAVINQLRRDALSAITARRTQVPPRQEGIFTPPPPVSNRPAGPGLTFSVQKMAQLTNALLARRPLQVYLPLEEAARYPEELRRMLSDGAPIAVTMPRIIWDREWPEVFAQLDIVQALGIQIALTGNLGQIAPLQARGLRVRGDFGLNVYNSTTLQTLQEQSLISATLSFELRFSQIRDLAKCIDTELLAYGRLPLMVTEQCIIRNQKNTCACDTPTVLRDRIGARFPVIREQGCRNTILNAKTLFLADKQKAYQRLGLWAVRLVFTTETPEACVRIADGYLQRSQIQLQDITRGLYYREVE